MKPTLSIVSAIITMTALSGLCRADDKREEKPRFKGVELYSWKDEGGGWAFVILDGTNRDKTEIEVKRSKNRIKGTDDLKKGLAKLAVGEYVFWTHRPNGFEFPPETIQTEIQKAAKDAEIILQISAQPEVVTTLGTHRFFDNRLSVELSETDGKIYCRIKQTPGFGEVGPIKPLFDKQTKWFVYPQSQNEIWTFDGRDYLILIAFNDDHPGNVSWSQSGHMGANGRKLPKIVRDQLPKEFLETHSAK